MAGTFTLDGKPVSFKPGQTIMQAAIDAGAFIPHLCFHPEFLPHGSCKLCTVKLNGRMVSACTMPAAADLDVQSNTPEINDMRRSLLQMLFVEGNHYCPGCEKSGNCKLQALAYKLEMMTPHYPHFYPAREVDASHPDFLVDHNRCILCELCVRASRDVDKKGAFILAGRGIEARIVANAPSGRLADTDFAASDRAADVCPVGAILKKRAGFTQPIGQRTYDKKSIDMYVIESASQGADNGA